MLRLYIFEYRGLIGWRVLAFFAAACSLFGVIFDALDRLLLAKFCWMRCKSGFMSMFVK